jgi:hypothetical protein
MLRQKYKEIQQIIALRKPRKVLRDAIIFCDLERTEGLDSKLKVWVDKKRGCLSTNYFNIWTPETGDYAFSYSSQEEFVENLKIQLPESKLEIKDNFINVQWADKYYKMTLPYSHMSVPEFNKAMKNYA